MTDNNAAWVLLVGYGLPSFTHPTSELRAENFLHSCVESAALREIHDGGCVGHALYSP